MRSWVAVLLLGALAGCEATEEDIERWKGTQRGPAKITAVVVESRYSYDMRGRAAVALVEIAGWDHFNAAFERLGEEDRRGVIHAMVPRLREMYNTGVNAGAAEGPTDAQVNAKDAMYDLYAWAAPEDQEAMQESLVHWITSDFNAHYLPGRRNIALIVEKVGPPATAALAKTLTADNALVAHKIAELIRSHGDESSKALASEHLAQSARALGDGIRLDYWKALALVCGDPARSYALEYAGRHDGRVDEQINALICVMEGAEDCRPGCSRPADVPAILDIAEDAEQDERVRAAAYDAARDLATEEHIPRFLKMLGEADVRYKATGLELAVHVGGAKVIPTVLERVGESRDRWPWQHKTQGQEYGFCNMGLGQLEQVDGARQVALEALDHPSPFVRGGAANIVGIVGAEEDVPRLERLASDRGRVKGWDPETVGAMAKQAVSRLRSKDRPASTSARRGEACGL